MSDDDISPPPNESTKAEQFLCFFGFHLFTNWRAEKYTCLQRRICQRCGWTVQKWML